MSDLENAPEPTPRSLKGLSLFARAMALAAALAAVAMAVGAFRGPSTSVAAAPHLLVAGFLILLVFSEISQPHRLRMGAMIVIAAMYFFTVMRLYNHSQSSRGSLNWFESTVRFANHYLSDFIYILIATLGFGAGVLCVAIVVFICVQLYRHGSKYFTLRFPRR